ncbi:chlorohydrolase [Streptococcus pneumoniae]|nr:chlorohydrolase [Streptococcus pneumoniae]
MKIKTRKLAAGCSKHRFEVADKADVGLKRFSKSIRKNQSPKGVDYEVIVYRNF